jgi:hypothetical protein
MDKQAMREEAERLIRETMETRVKFACKQCGHKQETL